MSELLVGKCWDVKARVQRMLLPTSEAAWELYSYYEDEAEQWLERQLTEFKQPFTWDWQVTPKSQLVRMYQVFYARGVVLDSYDKLYMPAFEQAVTNVERLQICCEAHGHTPHDIKDARENLRDLLEAKAEELGLMCEVGVGPDDIPLVSDYGMDPLINAALTLLGTRDMTEKFYAYDRLINVIHQRSDLPSLFVEGGSTTLDEIANAINPMELSCQNH